MKVPGYELSDHAADVIAEREIETTWVVRVLTQPERTEVDRSGFGVRALNLLTRAGPDSSPDPRVYNALVDPPRIVTVYFDRR